MTNMMTCKFIIYFLSSFHSKYLMNNEICVSQHHDNMNARLYERNLPSAPLQPYINARPSSTKYSFLPIVDPRKPSHITLRQQPTFNVETTFNPGNATAPWSGFASNINLESELRNQIFALQKCSQAVYVPSSTSDLYKHVLKPQTHIQTQTHSLLFQKEPITGYNVNKYPNTCGSGIFMNPTRCQIKDLTKCAK